MKNINPTKTKSWNSLIKHFNDIKNVQIKNLFFLDKQRFKKYSIMFNNNIFIDFSKNIFTDFTFNLLLNLAQECRLSEAINDLFSGKKINVTEHRAVLHTALRNRLNKSIIVNNNNIMIDINNQLKKMKLFSEEVINGEWKGCTGKRITDVVNIGIGGSYLGPYMVTESLRAYKNHLNIHYIKNIDGTDLIEILKKIDLESTIFLISSKSFTTDETLSNSLFIKNYFFSKIKNKNFMCKHFFALCVNINEAVKFGINKNNIFQFWEWVGGRYSLWSSSGLSIILSIGFKNFELLLSGAYVMDQHFFTQKFSLNIPVILALLSIWYTNFFNTTTEAVLPYDQYMHIFPEYLQQSQMESNGKSVDRNGNIVTWNTSPIIWGQSGTTGQHSFYQFLHQGTQLIPCDFIIPIKTHNFIKTHHIKLLSNFFAQTRALAFGNTNIKNNSIFKKNNNIDFPVDSIFNFKLCVGNKPTNSIILKKITPYSLGSLIALYEHKIFVQGIILNIFSYDQWGVELGKNLASDLYTTLIHQNFNNQYDKSTNGLLNIYKKWI